MKTTNNLNLVNDPWIPVVGIDNRQSEISLNDLFANGEKIIDLNVNALERIVLMRLLICIAQASTKCESIDDISSKNISQNAVTYLQKWESRFNLIDPHYPFMQMANVTSDTPISIDKLDFTLPSGNNNVFINNKFKSDKTTLSKLALNLIVYQNFASCGLIGKVNWNGVLTEKNAIDAICRAQNPLTSFVLKDNIIDSICANIVFEDDLTKALLVDKQDLGRPYWELEIDNSISPKETIINNTQTYLGRLMPLSRTIKIINPSETYLGEGISYKSYPDYRDCSRSFLIGKKGEYVLRTSQSKAVWRSLHSILSKPDNTTKGRYAYALNNVNNQEYKLWAGGIVTNNDKVITTIDSCFYMPAIDNNDVRFSNAISAYEYSINEANSQENRLGKAIAAYKKDFNVDPAVITNAKNSATFKYWNLLSEKQSILMEFFYDNKTIDDVKLEWNNACLEIAKNVYETVCQSQTPRQIRAFVKSEHKLWATSKIGFR